MKEQIQTVKKYWWVFLVLTGFVYILILRNKVENAQDTIQIQNVQISALNDSVGMLITDKGNLIAKIESDKVEKDNLKEALNILGIEKKDLKDQNVKYKKLIFATVMQISSYGNIKTPVIDTFFIDNTGENQDTTFMQKVNDWNDGKLFISNGKIINHELSLDWLHKIKFKLLVEDRKKESIVTVDFGNSKNIEVDSAQSITIDKSKKWFEKWWFWTAVGGVGGVLLAK